MRFDPKWAWSLSATWLLLALAVFVFSQESSIPPPLSPVGRVATATLPTAPTPVVPRETSPWYAPAPIRITPAPAALPPPPAVPLAAPSITIDRQSLVLVGHVLSEDGTESFFFKNRNTGIFLPLTPGLDFQGWKLIKVESSVFSLSGPGGLYEVRR